MLSISTELQEVVSIWLPNQEKDMAQQRTSIFTYEVIYGDNEEIKNLIPKIWHSGLIDE